MDLFKNDINFVTDDLKGFIEKNDLPETKAKNFTSRIKYALLLGFKEKEIFFFGLIQWLAILLAYLLWVQMLHWIPQDVWDTVARCQENNDNWAEECSLIADIPLLLWSFVCITLAAFPIGIFSCAMGVTHFLHKQNKKSTFHKCLNASFSNAWSIWKFHVVDSIITVEQIISRLPDEDDHRTAADIALSETIYYSWKLGTAGMIPALALGNKLIDSGKSSVKFVKSQFLEIAKLRSAYSLMCWIVGISAYVGSAIFIFLNGEFYTTSGNLAVASFYTNLIVPLAIAIGLVIMLLRPIYVLTICDLYSDYLDENEQEAILPNDPSMGRSALITFILICLIVLCIALFRDEMGLTSMLNNTALN